MEQKEVKKTGTTNFVDTMLQSAQENKEVKPQTRFDNVNPNDLTKVMENLKKGIIRK